MRRQSKICHIHAAAAAVVPVRVSFRSVAIVDRHGIAAASVNVIIGLHTNVLAADGPMQWQHYLRRFELDSRWCSKSMSQWHVVYRVRDNGDTMYLHMTCGGASINLTKHGRTFCS